MGNPLRYTDPSGNCIAPEGKTPGGSILYSITGDARDRFDCTFDEYRAFDFEFAQFYGQLVLDHHKRGYDPVAKLLNKLNCTPGRTWDLILFAAGEDYSRGCRATGWGQVSCPVPEPAPSCASIGWNEPAVTPNLHLSGGCQSLFESATSETTWGISLFLFTVTTSLNPDEECAKRHEASHIWQQRFLGSMFIPLYLADSLRSGGRYQNAFERSARMVGC